MDTKQNYAYLMLMSYTHSKKDYSDFQIFPKRDTLHKLTVSDRSLYIYHYDRTYIT